MELIKVLTTGAGGSASANYVDSLRLGTSSNYYIVGTDVNRYHIELNNVDKRYILPSCDKLDYITKLNEIIKREGIEFVHPQPDAEVLTLAINRDLIRAKTSLPDTDTIRVSQNKMKTNNILSSSGVPVAVSELLTTKEQTKKVVNNLLRWNEKVWLRAIEGAGSKAAIPVYSAEEAIGWIEIWAHRGMNYRNFMVSEYLPNNDFAFSSVWYKGELLTSAIRQRVMYLLGFTSPSGQSSTPSVAVVVDNQKVNDVATDAILAIDQKPHGAFYVDLKENARGIPCVTEINAGRFNATINFFTHAGINMPEIHTLLGVGHWDEVPILPKYNAAKIGTYWVRQIDMGYQAISDEGFRAVTI